MKILVAVELPRSSLDELQHLATELVYKPGLSGDELEPHLCDAAILIVGGVRVSAETIAAGRSLQLIVRAGADTSGISVDDASAQGIFVSNVELKDAAAIAEYAFACALALDRHLVPNALAAREGRTRRDGQRRSVGMAGRTLGLLGWGAVPAEIARRAAAFGMRVVAWHPRIESDPGPQVEVCDWPRELALRSDVVVAHSPPDAGDENLLDRDFLFDMREGASLVMIGHAGVVDAEALADAVRQRGLRVAIDLWPAEGSSETVRFPAGLLELPGVIGTYRQADQTRQADEAIAAEVVETVRRFVIQGQVRNCVNLLERSAAAWQLVLRLRDAVGVMAGIMDAIRADGINAEEITSRVFAGARAAWCSIALDERPSTEVLEAIRALPGVLHLEVRAVV
ncbi:MAG: hypothetical protein HRF50_16255 [Phycisphaerae bacterium]|jgi:D-3-phosphoglycerate dehydrogenase